MHELISAFATPAKIIQMIVVTSIFVLRNALFA